MKLTSSTDFILQEAKKECSFLTCFSYARLLKKTLKKEMFIPCDDKGNVLEKPLHKEDDSYGMEYTWAKEDYDKALSKVLFAGFQYNSILRRIVGAIQIDVDIIDKGKHTIEFLVGNDITVTDNFLNLINGE